MNAVCQRADTVHAKNFSATVGLMYPLDTVANQACLRRPFCLFIGLLFFCQLGSATTGWAEDSDASSDLAADVDLPSSAIDGIPPGTLVDAVGEDALWNRKLLVASPQLNSGDVDAVSSSVRDAATLCALTIMAGVEQAAENKRYEIKRLGIGYSVQTATGRMILSSERATELGVSLGFIARQVLKANERQLANVSLLARTRQSAVFDAPSVMYRNDVHRKYLTRHLVSIDPDTGQGVLMSWLLVPPQDTDHPMAIINQPIRVTKWGSDETRNIHIDAKEFNFLGVPGELAFALEDLPPGDDVSWTKPAASLANNQTYTLKQIHQLVAAIQSAASVAK